MKELLDYVFAGMIIAIMIVTGLLIVSAEIISISMLIIGTYIIENFWGVLLTAIAIYIVLSYG